MARILWLFTFGLLSMALIMGGNDLLAQQETPNPTVTPRGSYVVRDNIYVRGGPAESYQAVGMLRNGDPLIPLSRNQSGTWILISYYRGFGWVRYDLGHWATNLETLPIVDETNLTPTPIPGVVNNAMFIPPTETPIGNWLNVGDLGAYIRTGPGLNFPIYSELADGITVEPVGRSEDGQWILLRLDDGFAWIYHSLVSWADDTDELNILELGALTPSATFTNTQTPTRTATSTASFTPTVTHTPTLTYTPTQTPTSTATFTATNTLTLAPTETSTATLTNSPTATLTATNTLTNTPVATLAAQVVVISTNTPTDAATATETLLPLTATLTETSTATLTPSTTFTAIATQTSVPTNTAHVQATATETVNATWTFMAQAVFDAQTATAAAPTHTPRPTITQSDITPATLSFTLPAASTADTRVTADVNGTGTSVALFVFSTLTARAVEATAETVNATSVSPDAPLASAVVSAALPTQGAFINTTIPAAISPSVSTEAIVGGGVLLLGLAYIGFYWRGLSTLDRYKSGFVIEKCPVCGNGHLIVEKRQERTFGIPRGRYTIRCDECRSVLREAGDHQWRYAIDPMANPALYERFNNKHIDEATLKTLAKQPANSARASHVRSPVPPPEFLDDEQR